MGSGIVLSQIVIGFVGAGLLGLLAWRAGALAPSGAWGAALVGGLIFGFGGFPWAALLLTFFISSSALSKLFVGRKKSLAEEKFAKGSRRDWGQVLANGGAGAFLALVQALFPGQVAYIWHAGRHASQVQQSLEACKFEIRCQIIWAKDRFAISRGHYHWQHEPCWYAVRGNGHWTGDRSQTTLWKIGHQKSETGHSTQKPVECMKRPIENNSSPGQAVYEPFSGSGTTIIAGEMTGRSIHAIELSPAYVDVAVKRWQDFTGQQAVLEEDGRTFAEVAEARNIKVSCYGKARS